MLSKRLLTFVQMKIHKIGVKHEKRAAFTHKGWHAPKPAVSEEKDLNENQPVSPLWVKTERRICPHRCSWNSENQRRHGEWGAFPDCPQGTLCARGQRQIQKDTTKPVRALQVYPQRKNQDARLGRNARPTRGSGCGIHFRLWVSATSWALTPTGSHSFPPCYYL